MNMLRVGMMVMAVGLMVFPAIAQEGQPVQLDSDEAKVSYSLGAQIGRQLKMMGAEIDTDVFVRAINDVLTEQELALSQDEIQQVMMDFQREIQQRMEREREEAAVSNLAEGKAFLEAKKAEDGVTVTESGLMYEVLQQGTGETPTADDMVKVHYTVASIDGEEFDSSVMRGDPIELPVSGGMIDGWTEALTKMKVGDKWRLYLPADLAYGEGGRGAIPPNATLVFTVELFDIVDSYTEMQQAPATPDAE